MRIVPMLAIAFTLLLPALAQGAVPREDRQTYVGSATVIGVYNCTPAGVGIGNGCFTLDGSEQSVSLAVNDVTGLAVPFVVNLAGSQSAPIHVCASHIDDLAIPAGTTHVQVNVLGAPWGAANCLGMIAGSGVAGEIAARFG